MFKGSLESGPNHQWFAHLPDEVSLVRVSAFCLIHLEEINLVNLIIMKGIHRCRFLYKLQILWLHVWSDRDTCKTFGKILSIYTPSTRKGSHAQNKASHRRKWHFYSDVLIILLSFTTLGSESQISVFKQCQSNTKTSVSFCAREHPQKQKFG